MIAETGLFADDIDGRFKRLEEVFVRLSTFAIAGRTRDSALLSTKILHEISLRRPDLKSEIAKIGDSLTSTLRSTQPHKSTSPLPVDLDSRLNLLKRDDAPEFSFQPSWSKLVQTEFDAVLLERQNTERLRDAGLTPTKSLLFTGPPGVGKTLAARWLASRLQVPLLTLDLATVMSSYLGKTGTNIRAVIEYAKSTPCVLLLDEFDAVAKRRDDAGDVGELKRLVNVLLQALDEWPASNLLIAATNHPELLDPAIWRRFDRVVTFPLPSPTEIEAFLSTLMPEGVNFNAGKSPARFFKGKSYADISKEVERIKKDLVMRADDLNKLPQALSAATIRASPLKDRLDYAEELSRSGLSQREVSQLTGVARDTLRKTASHNS